MRLNPRQRRNDDGTGVIAGIPYLDLAHFAMLAADTILQGTEIQHMRAMAEINGAVFRGVVTVTRDDPKDWVDLGPLKMRGGRGAEISLIAQSATDFHSWLTNVTLGLYARYPVPIPRAKWTSEDQRLMAILEMLDKSADRRPYNRYTYRDTSYRDLGVRGWMKRREDIETKIRFRRNMDIIIAKQVAAKARSVGCAEVTEQ